MSHSVKIGWGGGHRFVVRRGEGASVELDGDAVVGPSPVDALVGALAACSGVDVVDILAKRKTPVAALSVDVEVERVETVPRRLKRVVLHFMISGEGIERVHAERAVDLAVNKYCSVRDSLREDIAVEWTLTVSGAA